MTLARPNGVTAHGGDISFLHSTTVGQGPISDIAVGDGCVVVTNFAGDSLAVLDADTLAIHGGVFAGQPTAIAIVGDRAFVAVSSAGYDAIAVIDTVSGNVVTEYPLAFNVTAIVASPDGKRVYAGRSSEDGIDVSVIDVAAKRVGTIYVAKGMDTTIDVMALDASGRRLFVGATDSRSSRLLTVDLQSARVRGVVEIGASIRGLQIGLDGTAFVLTSDIADGGVLYVIDLVGNRIIDSVRVADAPTQLLLSTDGTRAYVVDYGQVVVVDTDTRAVVTTIAVEARPSAIAVTAHRLYIADFDSGITAYAVTPSAPMLYAQFAAANAALAPGQRQLAPVGV